MDVSVVICTHNPRPDYLARTLAALRAQTLPQAQWELLLIDNASKEPLAGQWDLSWHSTARIIREDELGLTPARLRGIQESKGELLVFVDDDNVLDSQFLSKAQEIGIQWSVLGVWGGGVEAEFETAPPAWTKPFWPNLAIRPLARDMWTNVWGNQEIMPYGAGMCVRRSVAEIYAERTNQDAVGRMMGRKGQSLASGEDVEIALTALAGGFGAGRFKSLQLLHLIPEQRLSETYLLRLVEALEQTSWLLQIRHGFATTIPRPAWWRLPLGRLARWFTLSKRDRCFFEARLRGRVSAATLLMKNGLS